MYKYIIFDLGGVLIDWNPRHLYRKVFTNEDEMEYFLSEICNSDWNEMQDAGRSLQEGTQVLIQQHPQYEKMIRLYYDRWTEMLKGPFDETVKLLNHFLLRSDLEVYALTNWSMETFPLAQARYDFLGEFNGIIVSGMEKMKKPDPAIYRLLLARFNLSPDHCLFIDDNLRNVVAAQNEGIFGIHYVNPSNLMETLRQIELI